MSNGLQAVEAGLQIARKASLSDLPSYASDTPCSPPNLTSRRPVMAITPNLQPRR
jgi:hypothetical protein